MTGEKREETIGLSLGARRIEERTGIMRSVALGVSKVLSQCGSTCEAD